MTPTQRLALVNHDERDGMGHDQAPSLGDQLEASLFDAITKRLKAQEARIAALEEMEAKHRHTINRILVRFVTDRRPILGDPL